VHGGEQQIIAAIAEMRYAAFGFAEIANRGGLVDGGHAAPDEAHGGLGVKIEPPHPVRGLHDGQQRCDGIDAKAEQGIADGAEGFDFGKRVREAPADDAQPWGGAVEDRVAEDHGVGPLAGKRDEFGNQRGGMLAVAVHHQDMGKPLGIGCAQAVEHRRTLAAVARPDDYAQICVLLGPCCEFFARAVGAAVDDHPDGDVVS